MGEATCPICGYHFPIWLGEPLTECAIGGQDLCEEALTRARAAGMRRKLCPDAFDESGTIRPGQIARVMRACEEAGINPFTGLTRRATAAGVPGGRKDA